MYSKNFIYSQMLNEDEYWKYGKAFQNAFGHFGHLAHLPDKQLFVVKDRTNKAVKYGLAFDSTQNKIMQLKAFKNMGAAPEDKIEIFNRFELNQYEQTDLVNTHEVTRNEVINNYLKQTLPWIETATISYTPRLISLELTTPLSKNSMDFYCGEISGYDEGEYNTFFIENNIKECDISNFWQLLKELPSDSIDFCILRYTKKNGLIDW